MVWEFVLRFNYFWPFIIRRCCLLQKIAFADVYQVWSLTLFDSVDFSKSRIGVNKWVLWVNAQSRFASVVVDGVLGPLRLAQHT